VKYLIIFGLLTVTVANPTKLGDRLTTEPVMRSSADADYIRIDLIFPMNAGETSLSRTAQMSPAQALSCAGPWSAL
jgi:hypothetical protein